MSINTVHLNKFQKLISLSEKQLISELRKDIRQDFAKAAGGNAGGGDFYSPFWHDAKQHVLGQGDLRALTEKRIQKNYRKRNLYPKLRDGFLQLWQRGGNLEVRLLDHSPRGRYTIPEIGLTLKAEGLMAITIEGEERLVYPYWFADPALSEDAARLGIWALEQALVSENADNIRVFDIIAADYFSKEICQYTGREKQEIIQQFKRIDRMRAKLLKEYE